MSRSFGYTRVSTRKQADHGSSLLEQPDTILKYAAGKGLPEPVVFMDAAVEGDVPLADRPGGAKLIAAARPGDHVIVTSLDRGFRKTDDFLHWWDAWSTTGVTLHIIDFRGGTLDQSTMQGKLTVMLIAFFAEWEKKRISERGLAIHSYFRSQGLLITKNEARLGFKAVKNPKGKGYYEVPDPRLRGVMRQILEWYENGSTVYAIAQHLRVNKVPPPPRSRTGEWTEQYIYRLLGIERKFREAERKGDTAS